MSNPQPQDDNQSFRVLVGSSKISDYARVSFLVPTDRTDDILDALQKASSSTFRWSIDEASTVKDAQTTAASIAHVVQAFETIPSNQTEGELLGWLTHGEDQYSYQYVVLDFMDTEDWPDDGYLGRVAFEINRKKHVPFHDCCKKLCNHSQEHHGDMVYLQGCELIGRQQFL